MIGAANVPNVIRGKVGIKALKYTTQLDRLHIIDLNGQSDTQDAIIFGKNPSWTKNMHTQREAGVVKEDTDGKTGDRGILMMFGGYPSNQESDSVQILNPGTNRVVITCDVIWFKQMYYKSKESIVEFEDFLL